MNTVTKVIAVFLSCAFVKFFVEKNRITYPVALDTNAKAAMLYKVVGVPLNVVLE